MSEATEPSERSMTGSKDHCTDSPRARAARRRLLLGTAAILPSIYTLASGAQTAVASNARCWNRVSPQGGGGGLQSVDGLADDTARFSATQDNWLRKQVYTGTSGGHPAYCAMSDQAACIDLTNPGKAAPGSVWFVNGERVVAGAGLPIEHVGASPQAYGLVFVDQQGTVATLDPPEYYQQGNVATLDPPEYYQVRPVQGACWNSIIGGSRGSPLG